MLPSQLEHSLLTDSWVRNKPCAFSFADVNQLGLSMDIPSGKAIAARSYCLRCRPLRLCSRSVAHHAGIPSQVCACWLMLILCRIYLSKKKILMDYSNSSNACNLGYFQPRR